MSIALVTGASRGIGRATALALAAEGFTVGLVARSPADLEETRRLVEDAGGHGLTAVADITDPAQVGAAVDAIESAAGAIDTLVNNAGSLRAIGPLWEVDQSEWWEDVHISLAGAFNLCRRVVPAMIDREAGRIVNVVSYAGTRPAPYQSGYGAGKAALVNLTESLAASLHDRGITVFAVAPGFTETALTRELLESEAGRHWLPGVGQGHGVDAERTAALIAVLALGRADELNGRLLHTLDDTTEIVGRLEEVEREELYVPRVRRLPEL